MAKRSRLLLKPKFEMQAGTPPGGNYVKLCKMHQRRTRPREVMAGAPMRTPPGVMADTSPTTAFLLRVMCARSHTLSILLPVTPCQHSTIVI